MLNKTNLPELLTILKFEQEKNSNLWYKKYESGAYLKVDFDNSKLIYPIDQGFKVSGEFTTNFSSDENFVVLECVNRLFEKGYKPEHIELEPKWKLGHGASGGRADIFVRDQNNKPLLIVECKTAGKEFDHAWKKTLNDGDQLFSYIEQEKDVKYVCLYASSLNSEFNQVIVDQKVISHKDNQKILDENPLLDSYSEAKNVKERFRVWQQTYNLEFTESGIFEDNIHAYQIGKDKYTLIDDTRAITNADKKGKYNQFATILRKYNVSRKENAFEVLVNLFLCKIVDETQNPTDLKFYWKGIAYDNYYDFIDRLQELYKVGMEKYLEQDITYVSNQEIEGAFWAYKNKKNATRNTIKELFKKLKFYNDNNFGFIGVKNKEGFNKNAKIILEVTQMWQSLRLKTKEQNQFLGDMFEFFLDSGVKQSEGQFFTPVPICKFILMSLPLENMVTENIEPLKVIDYACGSGHFLTEYAGQIERIAKNKHQDPNLFYKEIYGIEKEDRLAKVAKVSAFMYGFDGVNIIDNDALILNDKIKEESFDILIANPPFAVKEFLTTIPTEERDKYELTPTVSDINTNDDIQNFFLERAKQLLNKGGIAGIVIPNTILTNTDKISVQTREILLRYFNFVSIVELPPSTFGKTETNTVVIYLERKSQRPEQEEHYKDRVNSFFDTDLNNTDFEDSELIKQYCLHNEFKFEDYLTLLQNKPNEKLLSLEIFEEYKSAFGKLSSDKKRKYNGKFNNYIQEIEKDKLYYFILANTNPKPVLIIRCPIDTKEQKKFVGYEWSGSKGSEGIRYKGGDTVYDITTVMFNPKNRNDETKISYYIRQNFIKDKQDTHLPETLTKYCSYHPLTNLLDFSRTSFDKAMSLTPKKVTGSVAVVSKYPMVKLGEESIVITKGTTPTSLGFEFQESGINFVKIESITQNGYFKKDKFAFIDANCNEKLSRSKLKENDILFSIAGALGRSAIVSKGILPANTNQALAIIRLKSTSQISLVYTFEYLKSKYIQSILDNLKVGVAQPNLSLEQISNFKIPVPPLEIQEQIVDECGLIGTQVETARIEIERLKGEIETKMQVILNKSDKIIKLSNSEIFDISIGKRVLQKDIENVDGESGIPVFSANVLSPFGRIEQDILKDFSTGSVLWGIDGDWIVNYLPPNFKFYPTDHCGILRLKKDMINLKYLEWALRNEGKEKRFSRSFRPSIDRIQAISIRVCDIKIQNQIVAEIEKIEIQITDNQKIIDSSKSLKQAILDKYLN
jgi:type I restriction enzyme M protein